MSLSIMTNEASLEAQRNVTNSQMRLAASVNRLSSGMRINRASDDAAGLAISSRLTATIRGIAQANRNGQDAVSMVQIAEAGLGQINGLMSRMRELAVQAANGGTVGPADRQSINVEFTAMKNEIDRIVKVTTYNGAGLIDGTLSAGAAFQVGAFNTVNDRISISVSGTDTTTLALNTHDVTTAVDAQNSLAALDSAISAIASQRAKIGANQNRLVTTIDNLSSSYNNLTAANGRILDTDVAAESANLQKNNILLQAGISVLAQANQQPQAALQLLR